MEAAEKRILSLSQQTARRRIQKKDDVMVASYHFLLGMKRNDTAIG